LLKSLSRTLNLIQVLDGAISLGSLQYGNIVQMELELPLEDYVSILAKRLSRVVEGEGQK
jgi:hypothetical protein